MAHNKDVTDRLRDYLQELKSRAASAEHRYVDNVWICVDVPALVSLHKAAATPQLAQGWTMCTPALQRLHCMGRTRATPGL